MSAQTFKQLRDLVGNQAGTNTPDQIHVTIDTTRDGKPKRYYWIASPDTNGFVKLVIAEQRGEPGDTYTHSDSGGRPDQVTLEQALYRLKAMKQAT